MELRHLRYFTAAAEELHFTRAAERIGIKQPPLSLQIRELERELGTPLFRRLTRRVELTDAGALLLEEARRILDQVEQIKTRVQRRARGETGQIRVGFAGATYFEPRVPRLIRAYRKRYPDVMLTPEQSNTPHLVKALHDGSIDVAFVRPPLGDGVGITIEPIIEEAMRIVLPSQHPQARNCSVSLRALVGEPLILFPRAIGPGLYDSIIASYQRAGLSPILGQQAPQIPSIVHLVAAGFGISVVPQSIEQIHADGVVYVGIDGEVPRALALAFRKDTRSATVRNFVSVARRHASLDPNLSA